MARACRGTRLAVAGSEAVASWTVPPHTRSLPLARQMYSTIPDAIKMVVGNKVDLSENRQVSKEEGKAFARQHGCLFIETSAKENIKVAQCFEELVTKMLETPQLVEDYGGGRGINLRQQREEASGGGCC